MIETEECQDIEGCESPMRDELLVLFGNGLVGIANYLGVDSPILCWHFSVYDSATPTENDYEHK